MSGTSATTSDAEIARNPHQPEGWWRAGIDFIVAPPPRCTQTSRRRRFANSTPSRSPQTSWYSWDKTLVSRASTLLLLFFSTLAIRGEVVDQVAALVEGEVISLSEVRKLVQYKGWEVPEEPQKRRDLYLTVLDQIINQKLISRQAQQTPGIGISQEEVDIQLQAYQRRFSSQVQFQENLKSMEMTESDLREVIQRELAVWKFVQNRFEPFIILLPQQIQKYYDETLVPQLRETGAPLPALELVQEQIREILILERTNQEMDRWVRNTRRKAQVKVLLFREPPYSPNLPQELLKEWELQPVPVQPTDR